MSLWGQFRPVWGIGARLLTLRTPTTLRPASHLSAAQKMGIPPYCRHRDDSICGASNSSHDLAHQGPQPVPCPLHVPLWTPLQLVASTDGHISFLRKSKGTVKITEVRGGAHGSEHAGTRTLDTQKKPGLHHHGGQTHPHLTTPALSGKLTPGQYRPRPASRPRKQPCRRRRWVRTHPRHTRPRRPGAAHGPRVRGTLPRKAHAPEGSSPQAERG